MLNNICYITFIMHLLKYYIPLIQEFKKHNYENIVYYSKTGKPFQCPI